MDRRGRFRQGSGSASPPLASRLAALTASLTLTLAPHHTPRATRRLQAKKLATKIFDRFKFSRIDKRQAPVSVVLVGNKSDVGRRQVTYEQVAEFMSEYIVPGSLV